MRISVPCACRALLIGLLLSLVSLPALAGNSVFEQRIFLRKDKPVYVVSNMPMETVMKSVCRDTLMRRDYCHYVPLNTVGHSGKRKKDLLPYNPYNRNETVVVIDRATLRPEETEPLSKLMLSLFPIVERPTNATDILFHIQNRGDNSVEYQVLIDLPEARWLPELTDELYSTRTNFPGVMDGSKGKCTFTRTVTVTAVLTNDPELKDTLERSLTYCDLTMCDAENFDVFRDCKANRRVIALNWNGPEQFTPAMAVQVLPKPLRVHCSEQQPDRIGVTGWQRYCRQAVAEQYNDGANTTWVITAPTMTFLHQLVDQVAANEFRGGPYRLKLNDFSTVRSLAVGTYVATTDLDKNQLQIQQQMEEVVGNILGSKVRVIVSTQNWGSILQNVLGANPEADDPFRRPDAVRVVNQASKSDALLLLWVKTLSPSVTYSFPCDRITPAYGEFTREEPDKPSEPDPDQTTLTLGGIKHVYPGDSTKERQASSKFQNDWNDWKYEQMPQYQKDHDAWESAKRKWENDRESYQVDYRYSVTSCPKVDMTGYLKMMDLVATQKVLWSTDVDLERTGEQKLITTIPVTVRGEGNTPPSPQQLKNYTNEYTWGGVSRMIGTDTIYAIGQTVMLESLRQGVTDLSKSSLWESDLKPWNKPGNLPTTGGATGGRIRQ